MFLTNLSRPSLRVARQAQQQLRSIHIENTVGDNLPFKYRGEGQTKTKVATKITAFFLIGFLAPFGIARYQMKKSGAWP
ncbi:hypothetical protein DFH28DRAFT_961209 [Melampsora americana]|nr:hypothetical protein DFH28DRAFT_961209 [Melampsora americana]